MDNLQPVKPLVAVSTHTLETIAGQIRRVAEVVFVIDAEGDLWRKERHDGAWARVA